MRIDLPILAAVAALSAYGPGVAAETPDDRHRVQDVCTAQAAEVDMDEDLRPTFLLECVAGQRLVLREEREAAQAR